MPESKQTKSSNNNNGDLNPEKFFLRLLDIRTGSDVYGSISRIKKNSVVTGANAWLLICSILVASLGLDLNSPAVIIGAMLISPLMSPILGVGLSVAINDRKTLNSSLRHFGLSILISLVTSTLYFVITPIGEITHEIVSRTKPTTLDILVAFFGGIAGIVSSSRKEMSNAIPGVAIATALMPPLCVTGFGIANTNLNITLNSFYLFFLNAVFVSLATYIIVKFLKFPVKEHSTPAERRKARQLITLFTFIMIVPSVFILRSVYFETTEKQSMSTFVEKYFDSNPKALEWKVVPTDSVRNIIIDVVGRSLSRDSLQSLNQKLKDYGLKKHRLNVRNQKEVGLEQIRQIEAEMDDLEGIAKDLKIVQDEKSEKDRAIDSLTSLIQNIRIEHPEKLEIVKKIEIAFEDVDEVYMAQWAQRLARDSFVFKEGLIIRWDQGLPSSKKRKKLAQLEAFIAADSEFNDLQIIQQN
ncbi:MAG TPA: DUF389 domain-containing protein [Saprospiraceae bacterium]|nr:DUF389 domain-containing protein [Saprospiraceae bacterium]